MSLLRRALSVFVMAAIAEVPAVPAHASPHRLPGFALELDVEGAWTELPAGLADADSGVLVTGLFLWQRADAPVAAGDAESVAAAVVSSLVEQGYSVLQSSSVVVDAAAFTVIDTAPPVTGPPTIAAPAGTTHVVAVAIGRTWSACALAVVPPGGDVSTARAALLSLRLAAGGSWSAAQLFAMDTPAGYTASASAGGVSILTASDGSTVSAVSTRLRPNIARGELAIRALQSSMAADLHPDFGQTTQVSFGDQPALRSRGRAVTATGEQTDDLVLTVVESDMSIASFVLTCPDGACDSELDALDAALRGLRWRE